MTPAPGVVLSEIHSTNIVESADELSVWLVLSDGSLIAVYLPLAELIERGNVIEAAPARSADDKCAENAIALVLARITKESRPH